MRTRVLMLLLATVTLAPVPAVAAPALTHPALPWVAPLAGVLDVTHSFQRPLGPYAAGHRGVDLGGPSGSVVVAAGDGVVVFAGVLAGRPVVSVQHGAGLRTTYEPVVPSVAAGRQVARGSPLGTLAAGHAGCPRDACLHWGLRRGEDYLDPLLLLRPPQVRLLPLG